MMLLSKNILRTENLERDRITPVFIWRKTRPDITRTLILFSVSRFCFPYKCPENPVFRTSGALSVQSKIIKEAINTP